MSQKKVIILGIDPGTRITGYGVIETDLRTYTPLDYGCIRPPTTLSLHERYGLIHEGIEHLLETYPIEAVSLETQFVGRNVQSALKLGMAKGVAIVAATKRKIPIFEYAPKKAKLAVTGTGTASKEQVQRMTQTLLNLAEPPKPEDAADALALAICHANSIKQVPYEPIRKL
ncbi:crossover junction endodeoxyribonuclease RuvC [Candidatus Neptunochlamydia vexilliferae]|uniref:Crossover junction endodeoxyribonuclease RuvC n=1 Tax=Candidatus Neptunichlamydia vexilliferae TaxID=1651774 RepID=A0ABS0AX85_9BACT|nr:crossover junction endodeoxyribonuclease RuvC [Candidatus Neptunochlamydia vexilliferae]MBF5058752.1 Crossover junction endodeoxyribonuclease RuvC [Candidatus Neptunochlamydia vexilliferae]